MSVRSVCLARQGNSASECSIAFPDCNSLTGSKPFKRKRQNIIHGNWKVRLDIPYSDCFTNKLESKSSSSSHKTERISSHKLGRSARIPRRRTALGSALGRTSTRVLTFGTSHQNLLNCAKPSIIVET